MTTTLFHSPGQPVTIFLDVLNVSGVLADAAVLPTVNKIYFPDLSSAVGYPASMIRIATGLYYYRFTLPVGAVGVGTYIVVVNWSSPESVALQKTYQIVVTAPFGNYSVSTM